MVQLFASDPKVLDGAACFAGTGVPVQSLFDYLSDGATVGSFLSDFPTVSREQVLAALEERDEDDMCSTRRFRADRSMAEYMFMDN